MYLELSTIGLCALLSICVSWTRSPFMALMFGVMLFVNASIVLLMLGFEFLALINILVYVGALAVLFLFVIMLLEIPSTELRAYHRGSSSLAFAGALACRLFLWTSPQPDVVNCTFIPTWESMSAIGHAFYIHYADLLILNSLILTVALFGALVLAHTKASS